MTVRIIDPSNPASSPEHSIWRLRKGERTVEARCRPHPLGHELVVIMDNSLLWSQVFQLHCGVLLGELAEKEYNDRLADGWILEPPTTSGATS